MACQQAACINPQISMADDPIAYCAEQVRRFDHDRYLCALLAPEAVRPGLLAIYAFNVEIARVREIVSEAVIGQMRLQWWRDALDEFALGKIRDHPVAQALARTMAERRLERTHFERLLTGREFDLEDKPPPTLAALETYAESTSSALFRLALEASGVTNAAAAAAAEEIGLAWALTGLLRAVPFHAGRRRLYLPLDMLAAADIEPEDVFENRAGARLAGVVRTIAGRARERLAAARARRRDVPRAAVPVLLPALLAERHLGRLERAGFDPFAPQLSRPSPGDALRLTFANVVKRF